MYFNQTIKDISSYENIGVIGEGTYGKVYKAKHRPTEMIVAVKKIELEEDSGISLPTIREIKNLQRLNSEFIVKMIEVIQEGNYYYLVMEYVPFDLTGLIKKNIYFDDETLITFCYELLKSISYLHSKGIIHRDIKSSNILMTREGKIKLVDFGLAREKCNLMTNRVCTLWYRAPELLLGSENYDEKIDTWSVGCVILELRLKKVPYKGSDEVSQIKNIFMQLGSPKEIFNWSDMFEQSSYTKNEPFLETITKNYGEYFNDDLLFLLSKLLCLDPKERMTPVELLELQIFKKSSPKFINIDIEDVNEYIYNEKNKL
ncbi:cyclin-dependent kinase [Tubulinosema ratisbonensis]|uniref:Cyclin-dependent kinase 8 n=1 Tax=Tubulinosema ratisbonensis TaxID=291195 RepID=A0A437AQ60_9MICR|nr:cyclin-dependent kinase [Tubulinosema ratisbonensis]